MLVKSYIRENCVMRQIRLHATRHVFQILFKSFSSIQVHTAGRLLTGLAWKSFTCSQKDHFLRCCSLCNIIIISEEKVIELFQCFCSKLGRCFITWFASLVFTLVKRDNTKGEIIMKTSQSHYIHSYSTTNAAQIALHLPLGPFLQPFPFHI